LKAETPITDTTNIRVARALIRDAHKRIDKLEEVVQRLMGRIAKLEGGK
jgi:ubiquinone biosynthesis protein UbiJ